LGHSVEVNDYDYFSYFLTNLLQVWRFRSTRAP